MIEIIKNKIEEFKRINDIHQYRMLLDTADLFFDAYPNGVTNDKELDLGIDLLRELISLTYIVSYKQYDNDFELEKEIRHRKIKVFKLCIPSSHSKLRGLTELLLGMKENAVG
jgi:hypothetical protein